MFNKKAKAGQDAQAQIEALQKEIEELKYTADRNYRMLRSVNNSSHLSIWIAYFDEEGNQSGVHFTDEMRRALGYSKDELPDVLDGLAKIIHPDDLERVLDAYGKAVADKNAKYDIDYRLLTKSGEYRLCHAAGECVRKPNGKPEFFIGTFMDIQDQEETKATLEISQRRQGAVEQMMLEGSWSMDLVNYKIDDPTSPMVFSDQFKKILGYSSSIDFPDVMSSWITKMHPDDVAEASAAMGKQLSDPTGATVFDMEYRMLHKKGDYIWVRASSMVVWSPDRTTPLMAAGTILDITEEKNNQLKFQTEMAPNIESLRKGITEIAKTVDLAAEQMNDVAAKQEEVTESAKSIEQAVDASMEIIGSIQSIADQTNLLSLNASIEAARAGEAGRGFAVVATEVQNLSNSTKETTGHISEILTNMNNAVKGILEKITQISDSISVENQEMASIDSTIDELHAAADEIAEMAATLYK